MANLVLVNFTKKMWFFGIIYEQPLIAILLQLPPCTLWRLAQEERGEELEAAGNLLQRLRLCQRRLQPRLEKFWNKTVGCWSVNSTEDLYCFKRGIEEVKCFDGLCSFNFSFLSEELNSLSIKKMLPLVFLIIVIELSQMMMGMVMAETAMESLESLESLRLQVNQNNISAITKSTLGKPNFGPTD